MLLPGNDHLTETIIKGVTSSIANLVTKPENLRIKSGSALTIKDFEAFGLQALPFDSTSWKEAADVNLKERVTNQLKSYKDKILQNKKLLKKRKIESLSNEKKLVQSFSHELLKKLVSFSFKNIPQVSAVRERQYGQVSNSVSIITGSIDQAIVYRMKKRHKGLCLGLWEDKGINHDLNEPEMAQLCAAMIAEESLFESVDRYPPEMCGILANGLDFVFLKRRRRKGNTFTNLCYPCENDEQIVKALVHFLVICHENLKILTSADFDVLGYQDNQGSIPEKEPNDESSDAAEEKSDEDDGGGKKTPPPSSTHAPTNQRSLQDISFIKEYFARCTLPLTRQNLESLAY
jgi:hypothetical protein